MNVLIVFSHPGKSSYTSRVLEQLKAALLIQNWKVEVSDLYAINFQTDMNEEEYERESLSKTELPVAADVLREHEKINKADCIIFLYPVWWSDCPAKLKGWFDRVFTVGYAYKHNNTTYKMRRLKYGVAICTAGYSNETLIKMGITQSMQTIMLNDRLGNRFENKDMFVLGGTLDIDSVKESHKQQIEAIIKNIEHYCIL